MPDVLPGDLELIGREIRSDNGPTGFDEERDRTARSAAEIEASSGAAPEQPNSRAARLREDVARGERLVPVRLPVVARAGDA
jgi:hypothetical protein